MATQTYPSKMSVEDVTMDFDMLSRCKVGEFVVTATVVCGVYSGVDPSASAMISGVPSIANNVVSQKVKGGVPGNIYLVSCSVRTSDDNVYVNEAKLAVLTTSAPVPPVE